MNLLELSHPFHHLLILVTTEVLIGTTGVPGVEGMEPDHIKAFVWNLAVVVK